LFSPLDATGNDYKNFFLHFLSRTAAAGYNVLLLFLLYYFLPIFVGTIISKSARAIFAKFAGLVENYGCR